MSSEPSPSRIKSVYQNWLKPMVVMLTILFVVRSSLADWNDVPTQSMEPTLLVGDRIFINKLAYGLKVPFTTWHVMRWSAPQRGEIIVFYSPKDGARMVKRLIGEPGDTVSMTDNQLVINGVPVPFDSADTHEFQSYELTDPQPLELATEQFDSASHALIFQPARPARRSFTPVTIPDGFFLVMGDNRDNSADSRYFGLVPRDQILGRMVGVALSLDTKDHYKPRWKRFFHGVD